MLDKTLPALAVLISVWLYQRATHQEQMVPLAKKINPKGYDYVIGKYLRKVQDGLFSFLKVVH